MENRKETIYSLPNEFSVGVSQMDKEKRTQDLIDAWLKYRSATKPISARCDQLRQDLYKVRNPELNGNPPISVWPPDLIDKDPEIMASVEHYFLTRAWIGTGKYPAWEVKMLCLIYNSGKSVGLSPRHNPANPVTPSSAMQKKFQAQGIRDGESDLKASGGKPSSYTRPPVYY